MKEIYDYLMKQFQYATEDEKGILFDNIVRFVEEYARLRQISTGEAYAELKGTLK